MPADKAAAAVVSPNPAAEDYDVDDSNTDPLQEPQRSEAAVLNALTLTRTLTRTRTRTHTRTPAHPHAPTPYMFCLFHSCASGQGRGCRCLHGPRC